MGRSQLSWVRKSVALVVVMKEAEDVVAGEFRAAFEEVEFDGKAYADDLPA